MSDILFLAYVESRVTGKLIMPPALDATCLHTFDLEGPALLSGLPLQAKISSDREDIGIELGDVIGVRGLLAAMPNYDGTYTLSIRTDHDWTIVTKSAQH